MANDSLGQVMNALTTAGGSTTSSGPSLGEQLAALTAQLQANTQAQSQSVAANTKAATQAPAESQSSGSGIAATLIDFLGIGSGLSPLIKGLFSLFGGGGGSQEAPPGLPTYAAPPSVSFEGLYDFSSGSVTAAAAGQGGQARSVSPRTGAGVAGPQITVNVQAMDSQSFLDHSDDIARAVRVAMLQSNVLNDVVREL